MIPTAEEFCNDIRYVTYSLDEKLITFAKMHVKEALKWASIDAEAYVIGGLTAEVDKSTILTAYPLENIK